MKAEKKPQKTKDKKHEHSPQSYVKTSMSVTVKAAQEASGREQGLCAPPVKWAGTDVPGPQARDIAASGTLPLLSGHGSSGEYTHTK